MKKILISFLFIMLAGIYPVSGEEDVTTVIDYDYVCIFIDASGEIKPVIWDTISNPKSEPLIIPTRIIELQNRLNIRLEKEIPTEKKAKESGFSSIKYTVYDPTVNEFEFKRIDRFGDMGKVSIPLPMNNNYNLTCYRIASQRVMNRLYKFIEQELSKNIVEQLTEEQR